MGRASVIPAVRLRLESYLNDKEAEYQAQPDALRKPTLPSTPDNKINVRAVARAIDLSINQEKYLYEREELSQLISMMAEGQGLLPIGSRLVQEAGDKALKERLVRQAQVANASAQAAIEAQAVHAELLQKLSDAVAEIEALKFKLIRLEAQLDAVNGGMLMKVID
jgi:hypothetical protein